MAGFVLSEEVSELDFNFEPYGGSGKIPEPSAYQITRFKKGLAELVEMSATEDDNTKVDDMPTKEFAQRLSKLLSEDTSEQDTKVLHVIADVCSDNPSFDELEALPYRPRQAFFGWLVGVLIVPEGPRPATTS
jgi:hypothetical protein